MTRYSVATSLGSREQSIEHPIYRAPVTKPEITSTQTALELPGSLGLKCPGGLGGFPEEPMGEEGSELWPGSALTVTANSFVPMLCPEPQWEEGRQLCPPLCPQGVPTTGSPKSPQKYLQPQINPGIPQNSNTKALPRPGVSSDRSLIAVCPGTDTVLCAFVASLVRWGNHRATSPAHMEAHE